MDLDGGVIHNEGRLKGWALKLRLFWALKWQRAQRVPFGPKKVEFATGVVDTGGAPWLANISANFRKNLKRSKWNTLGLGGN